MKNIKYIIMTMALLVGMTSCEDAYEIEPTGILDEEATFFAVEDAQTYLNGVYAELGNTAQIQFTSIFTDEVAPSADWNGSNRETHQFVLNSTSGFASILWLQGHRAVNRANRLIVGSENIIPANPAEEAALNDIVAQGRFIRAYAYLNLLSFFSTDMTDDSALGAMLFTNVPASNDVFPRATNGEIYTLIESDLNFAFNNVSNDNVYIYPTKAAVEALQARMYTYRGKYTEAATHANNVINNYGLSLTVSQPYEPANFYHPANSTNPYRQIWSDIAPGQVATQHENIFALQSKVAGTPLFQPAGIFYQNTTRCSGSPLWSMSYKLYDMYKQDPNDVRQFAFVDKSSENNACNDGEIMIDKYPGVPSGGNLVNNLKLMRLSEMYMILAEAAVQNNALGQAAQYIHDVKVARSINGAAAMPTYANQTDGWAGVLAERRMEFFAEGYRYIDLRRLGQKANKSIDRDVKDNEFANEPTTISIEDHRFTMPVPFDEIQVNSLIIQNPGY